MLLSYAETTIMQRPMTKHLQWLPQSASKCNAYFEKSNSGRLHDMSAVFLVAHTMVVLIGLRWKPDWRLRELTRSWSSTATKTLWNKKLWKTMKSDSDWWKAPHLWMNHSCPTLAFFLTPMPQNVSSMEPTSVLRELMLTPRTSSHHSKSPLQLIRLTSSPTRFHCRTTRHTGNGVRNSPPPPYLVCTLVIGRLQLKVISSLNSMLSSLTSLSPLVTLPSSDSKGYRSCLKRRRGYAYLPNSMPSY